MVTHGTNWAPKLAPRVGAARLLQWGYFPDQPDAPEDLAHIDSWRDDRLASALQVYQETYKAELDGKAQLVHGRALKADGEIGPATEALLETPRCGVADRMARAEANWPAACRHDLTFAPLFERLAPLNPQDTIGALRDACAAWTVELELKITVDVSLGRNAHIWADKAALRGSTLAWSYLAQNSCAASLEQRYNTGVSWTRVFLQGVSCHELGHALGLGHLNDPRALMYPYARPEIFQPHELDIEAAIRVGYERRTGEPAPPVPKPPEPGQHRIEIVGSISELRINGRRIPLPPAAGGGDGTDWT